MRSWRRIAVAGFVAGLTAACLPVRARAQAVGFESAYQSINDINFFFTCWHLRGDLTKKGDCPNKNGYGIEVSYNIGKVSLGGPVTISTVDTAEKTVSTSGRNDTTYKLVPKRRSYPKRYIELEFALGYSQFSGFGSPDSSFDIVGNVRELPSVAMYGNLRLEDVPVLSFLYPYVGLKSGLIQLSGVQLLDHYKPDSLVVYNGSAQVFQFGGVAGVVLDLGPRLHLFAEQAWHFRRIDGVQWTSKSDRIKPSFPRTLDFTGPATTVGLQLTIRTP